MKKYIYGDFIYSRGGDIAEKLLKEYSKKTVSLQNYQNTLKANITSYKKLKIDLSKIKKIYLSTKEKKSLSLKDKKLLEVKNFILKRSWIKKKQSFDYKKITKHKFYKNPNIEFLEHEISQQSVICIGNYYSEMNYDIYQLLLTIMAEAVPGEVVD